MPNATSVFVVQEHRGTVGRILRRRPALGGVYLLYFGANVLLYTIIVYYPQLLETIGVTSALGISLYLAASGAAGGISGALYGRLVIRATRMRLVTIAFLLWSVAFSMITLIDTPVAAAPPVFLFGLGIGLVFPSTFAWVEALAPQDRQGQFSSYIASFGYTGQFLSPLIFGPLVGILGVRGAFGAAGVTTVSDWSERTFGSAIEIGRMFIVGSELLIKQLWIRHHRRRSTRAICGVRRSPKGPIGHHTGRYSGRRGSLSRRCTSR